jgi:SAM-dependent methyltransferase
MLWLYLARERPDLLGGARSLLHFAPEQGIRRRLASVGHLDYVTTDLDDPSVAVRADITALPFPEGRFDALLCSHVLEHVPDDSRAMRELVRVLRPGGWAIVLVPLDLERAATLEDPAIDSPEARLAAYWQADHVRLYGRDFPDRLSAAGFEVTVDPFVRRLEPEAVERYGLFPREDVYLCRRPVAG